ncbi:MAG: hypothetical protein OCD76_17485 [Reichenbachiella sp.]
MKKLFTALLILLLLVQLSSLVITQFSFEKGDLIVKNKQEDSHSNKMVQFKIFKEDLTIHLLQ